MSQALDNCSKPRSISRVGGALIIIWALFAIIIFSDAGVNTISLLKAFFFSVAWFVLWASRLVWFWLHSRKSKVFRWDAPSVIFWSIEPIAFLFIASLAYSNALMFARLYVSSSALEQYANGVRDGKVDVAFEFTHPSRRVGLYSISITDAMPDGGVRFITSSHGLFDRAGFAYYPNGAPPGKRKNSYTHIFGPWWQWKSHF